MKKYLFFTEDTLLVLRLKEVFPSGQVQFKPIADFPDFEEGNKLVVVDGDSLPPERSFPKLKRFKRKKIPVVYLFTDLSGRRVIDLLNNGIISVLYKDYPAERIKSELKEILFNFNYLEKVKDIAENDSRTRRFLSVVSTLTSDNDINKIMYDILKSMVDVFKLESTIFFIVKQGRLKHKIELGQSRRDYSSTEWELGDAGIEWLAEIQQTGKPIYITKKSKKDYKRYFPENTLLLPLVIKEKFFGLITAAQKPGAARLSRNEIALLMAFAQQTAVALENAKLYWDMLGTREQLVKQEKNALLNQAIISLNHEINNPLSVISMEAQLLHRRLENKEDKIESRIARIEKNIDRIKVILERISSLNADNLRVADYIDGIKMLNLHEN